MVYWPKPSLLNQLLSDALAVFVLVKVEVLYLGNANLLSDIFLILLADHKAFPTKGISLLLTFVFKDLQGWFCTSKNGTSESSLISSTKRPVASANLIPVSDMSATSHLSSSSISMHLFCITLILSIGIGSLLPTPANRSYWSPLKWFFVLRPYSLLAKLKIAFTIANFLVIELPANSLFKR